MTIKSLLLGSAAALAVVSGAQAADAIVAAEPEPAEYVKVCDAMGTGFFYIPGTETCLKIGGYIRNDTKAGALLGLHQFAKDANGDFQDTDKTTWSIRNRFALKISTAAETEMGTLKTYAEVRFDGDNGSTISADKKSSTAVGTAVKFPYAYIELGGLLIGRNDSLFTTFTGYAGSVINDGQVGYGPFDSNIVQYTYDSGNGFSVAGSLEDDDGAGEGYVPNIVAAAGYSTDALGVKVVGAYDEALSSGAVKARIDGKFGGVSVFAMAGYKTGDADTNHYAGWGGDWALWAGLSAPISDSATFNSELDYDADENFGAAANVAFTLAPGFAVTPEVAYYKDGATGDSSWGGMVRVQRSF